MANVDAVKDAIENLTAVEYIELQHWLEEKDSAEQPIDYQLKADWTQARWTIFSTKQ